jgi:D-arabinose 1-dehydrogenase-like Zn-dependent alcohol dehydrogenase
MLEFSHKHNIYPLVETHSFEEFPQAFAKLEHGRPRFRCVVNVIDWAKANGFEK